jgi:porin
MKRLDPRKDLMKTAIHTCMLAFLVLAVSAVNGAETDWPEASSTEAVFFPEPGDLMQTSWSATTYDATPPSVGTRHCPHSCGHDFWTREHLANGFLGLQPALAQHGIVYDAQLTQFYQGVTDGGADQTFRYGGKLDQFVILNSGQLGLWEGMTVVMHAESRFGEAILGEAAALAPSNANMLYPSSEDITAITALQITQALSEDWALTCGKINVVDFFYALYPQTGRGVDGFMNTSIFLPLTVGRTIPLSFLGAGVLKMHGKQIQGALIAYDSHNSTTTSGFDELFDNGANIVGLWRFFTEFGGLPGSHLFLGTGATGDFTSLDPLDWVIIPGGGVAPAPQTGSWSLAYILEQSLWADRCNAKRNIGLMSQWGLSDEVTSPFRWVANVSLQGSGLVCGREDDSMGVGYFYNGLSGDFKDLLSPFGVRDVQGVELYYNAAVTPWFHLTADLQVVQPEIDSQDTAVVFGLRGKIDL